MMARILIVDDTTANREVLSDALADEGYQIDEATDGLDKLRVMWIQDPRQRTPIDQLALLVSVALRPGDLVVAQPEAGRVVAVGLCDDPDAWAQAVRNCWRQRGKNQTSLAEALSIRAESVANACSKNEITKHLLDLIAGEAVHV